MRAMLLTLLLLPAPLLAVSDTQVEWAASWEEAFKLASAGNLPVMVCINSKDGEGANERAAKSIYHDPEFVAESRKFVMLVVSTLSHAAAGECPRFLGVTCGQHGECYRELRNRHGEQFVLPGGRAEMISPQHAWFRPDGTLLRRKEYEMTKAELLEKMRQALADVQAGGGGGEGAGSGDGAADAPLTEKELAELQRARTAEKEGRRAAIGNLLDTGKKAAVAALVEMLADANEALACDLLRAFGRARIVAARTYLEDALKNRSEKMRSFAAVALEELAQAESIPVLMARVKVEKDTFARKNAYRALGACGGGAADKKAAEVLLKGLQDKNAVVGKHAALALRSYGGPATELVLKPLEKFVLQEKNPDLRAAITYTLAHIGNKETTLPVIQKLLGEANNDLAKAFYRSAIDVLKREGGDFGRSAWWLFREDRDDPARE
ncbi:MAG: HEAT repeat domain-containing protein [Planctomycetaceae bacterium]